jgi:hypothetical protein
MRRGLILDLKRCSAMLEGVFMGIQSTEGNVTLIKKKKIIKLLFNFEGCHIWQKNMNLYVLYSSWPRCIKYIY